MRYTNPILPGFHPDPSICRVGEDYYLVTSTAEYFPGIPVYHSRDLIHWECIGYFLTRGSQADLRSAECSGGIWAPTIRWHEGVFYVCTTNTHRGGNFILTAADPAGPWSEPVWVEMGGIDPSLCFDEGHVYFTTNYAPDGCGISQAEIDPASGKLLSPVRLLWRGTGGRSPEAPHLYHIGDWYYLMIAEGGTQFTHRETIARSRAPFGPFAPCAGNPILHNANTPTGKPVACYGHGDLVQDSRGNWWMVHLGIRLARKYMSHLGRETFLSPVQWDADGWPIVNYGRYVDVTAEGPLPEPCALPPAPEYDDFSALKLGYCWNTLRASLPLEAYSLAARPGWLTLGGSAVTLDNCATPVFVAQRQRGMACTLETLLDFEPGEGETAGIALLLSNEFYIAFGKSRRNGIETLELRRRAEDMEQAQSVPIAVGRITLQIQADCLRYRFRWALQDGVFHEMGTASTRFLACEVAGRSFTGIYAGLFAQGSGVGCRNPAYFDYFMQHVTETEQ